MTPPVDRRKRALRRAGVAAAVVFVAAGGWALFGHDSGKYMSNVDKKRVAQRRHDAIVVGACLAGLVCAVLLCWYWYWRDAREYRHHLETGEPLPDRFMRTEKKSKAKQKPPAGSPTRRGSPPAQAAHLAQEDAEDEDAQLMRVEVV